MKFPHRLVEGYRAFRATRLRLEQERYQELGETGQKPEVMVIGCCDSRVSPEVIFNARPGELFVVRNVANLVPPYSPSDELHGVSAALEFAVQLLKVKHIVVLGHGRCGGIRAFAEQEEPLSSGDFIGKWVSLIEPAAAAVGPRGNRPAAEYLTHLEQASIMTTLDNLMTFPCISILVERQRLHLHAAYFDVSTGLLTVRDPETGTFDAINGNQP
jgi:carbonic anhydrase